MIYKWLSCDFETLRSSIRLSFWALHLWALTHNHCVKSVQIRSFFLVRIFPHSDWIRRDKKYLSVFSLNTGKYRPEKTPYLDTFHAVNISRVSSLSYDINLYITERWKLFIFLLTFLESILVTWASTQRCILNKKPKINHLHKKCLALTDNTENIWFLYSSLLYFGKKIRPKNEKMQTKYFKWNIHCAKRI